MKIEYLPLCLELFGVSCLVGATCIWFGPAIALLLAAFMSVALGLVLEARREQERDK
jgi:uncharacterized membrane protein